MRRDREPGLGWHGSHRVGIGLDWSESPELCKAIGSGVSRGGGRGGSPSLCLLPLSLACLAACRSR